MNNSDLWAAIGKKIRENKAQTLDKALHESKKPDSMTDEEWKDFLKLVVDDCYVRSLNAILWDMACSDSFQEEKV